MKRFMTSFAVFISLLWCGASAFAYEFSPEYWSANTAYGEALQTNNYQNIITYGQQTLNLSSDMPDGKEKRDMIVSRTNEIGKAYAALGDYEGSADTFRRLYDYASAFGSEYYDHLKASKAYYEQYTPVMQIYTDNGRSPYYSAVNEKQNGVLFGVCATSETRSLRHNESMVLVYQEFGQPLLAYNKSVVKEASEKGLAVEFALNCPKHAADIKNTQNMSSYLKEISDMLSTYGNVPVYLRFGAEFDVWSDLANPEDFKSAFRYVSNYFKSRNSNVAMVWSPNQTSNWYVNIDDYYPGDEYVDWVGASSYAQKYFLADLEDNELNEIVFKSGINADPVIALKDIVEKYGAKKPIMVSEMGCGHRIMPNGENTSDFALRKIKEYYSYLPMVYPQIKLMAYFDNYVSGEKNDYRLSSNQALLNEYTKLTKSERFIQDGYENTSYLCYRRAEDNITVENTFLVACYAHKYNNETRQVTYYIDDKYAGMSTEVPFSTYINSEGLTGGHTLKATVLFADGSTMTSQKAINISSLRDITVQISGSGVSFDQRPIIYNERTMVPLRKIFEELGAEVSWNQETGTATGKRGDRTVKVSIGERKMYVNSREISLDTSPFVISERTLVPVRAVAEGMGSIVDWDGGAYLVSITPKIFEWSQWATSLPDGIDDLYYTEEKKEYRKRTRDKENYTTTSSLGSSSNYVKTETSYGSWSDWQNSYISASPDLEVDTRTQTEKKRYHYAHYCIENTPKPQITYPDIGYNDDGNTGSGNTDNGTDTDNSTNTNTNTDGGTATDSGSEAEADNQSTDNNTNTDITETPAGSEGADTDTGGDTSGSDSDASMEAFGLFAEKPRPLAIIGEKKEQSNTAAASFSAQASSYAWTDGCEYHDLGWLDYELTKATDGGGGYIYDGGRASRICSNGVNRWFLIETSGADRTYTQYRSRTVKHTYTYWRWTDWSQWSQWEETRPQSGESGSTEIEERTVYRYKEK